MLWRLSFNSVVFQLQYNFWFDFICEIFSSVLLPTIDLQFILTIVQRKGLRLGLFVFILDWVANGTFCDDYNQKAQRWPFLEEYAL